MRVPYSGQQRWREATERLGNELGEDQGSEKKQPQPSSRLCPAVEPTAGDWISGPSLARPPALEGGLEGED